MRSFIVCLLLCFGLIQAQAAEYRSEEKFGLRVEHSARWTQTVPPTDGTVAVLRLADSNNVANGHFGATFPENVSMFSSMRAWIEDGQQKFIKKYGKNYSVKSSSEGTVKLGNGLEGTYIQQEVSNENSDRSVMFLFWESEVQGRKVWNYTVFSNKFRHFKLSVDTEPMSDLIRGIK
ncbi:MAG: hypothetical protein Q8O53_02400 [Candidatus Moranbacteria bacterium]|nr:hypothetical protein [Candidatus Moranbacteria bacterium]